MKRLLRGLGGWIVDRRIARGLDGVFASGIDHLVRAAAGGPVVVACTHQSWWDGLVVVWLCRRLGLHPCILMQSENLEQWPFFAMFGALGVRGPVGVRAGLAHLRGPGDVVWVFPQGRYRDPSVRPLELARGASWLATHAGCALVPVALGYRLVEAPVVRAFLSVAPAIDGASDLEGPLAGELDRIEGRLGFEPLARPAVVAPGVASRALGWIWRRL
ncbi:MAG: lysophospholipid acyltransferase family protein [Myxococcota bacterium]